MRKLTYDCYYKDTFVTTVSTLKEANEWKTKDNFNSYKISLVNIKNKETEKEIELRLAKIAKRQEAIRSKAIVN